MLNLYKTYSEMFDDDTYGLYPLYKKYGIISFLVIFLIAIIISCSKCMIHI